MCIMLHIMYGVSDDADDNDDDNVDDDDDDIEVLYIILDRR